MITGKYINIVQLTMDFALLDLFEIYSHHIYELFSIHILTKNIKFQKQGRLNTSYTINEKFQRSIANFLDFIK